MLRFEATKLQQGRFTLRADAVIGPGLTAIIGPSGGGKSTLLAAVAGFLTPSAGKITYNGEDLAGLAPSKRPVSMMFQDHNLFPHMTVARNVSLAISRRARLIGRQSQMVSDVIGRVGLAGLEDRRPAQLSGGQQSRAALARMLLQDRPVICLDEPFAALGPGLREEMLAVVAETLKGRTILMVTHDPREAEARADQVLFVDEGAASGPFETTAFLRDPPDAMRRYMGQKPPSE